MQKLLLASAAFAVIGIAPAMAGGSVNFNLSSNLGKTCTIAATNTNLTVGPAASAGATGTFETNCNFEISDLTLTFTSGKGGLYNSVEGITELYNLTFDGTTVDSGTAQGGAVFVRASGPVANNPVTRTFDVALQHDLAIAGDYSDVLTVEVAP